jgi:MauM/NapG family ferredoxin protein
MVVKKEKHLSPASLEAAKNAEPFFTPSRISQLVFLIIFFVLFVMTDYRGKDEIGIAVNGFFRADPLVAMSYFLAVKAFTWILLPAVVLAVSTVVLGRFFCGWICPLGTLIDLVTPRIPKLKPIGFLHGRLKYYLLFSLFFAALFSLNISGIFDPIAILIRALTFFFYPVLGFAGRSGWSGLYKIVGENRDNVAFIHDFLRAYILPFRDTFYPLAFVSLGILLLIFILERFEKRAWCKNICPLGTLLGILGKFSLFRRIPGRLCNDCGECRDLCPSAFDGEIFQSGNCIRCMNCQWQCRFKRAKFIFKPGNFLTKDRNAEPVLSRRIFLGSLLSGFVLAKSFSFREPQRDTRLLRPPGVTHEDEFLKKCVRCGECMKVCLRGALYPDFSRSGITGIFTPVVIPRLGYCEYNCTLCGQVCPTHAIPRLSQDEKKKAVIGLAVIDRNLCLPYAQKLNCLVCEEHCPVPEKAIRFEIIYDVDYNGRKRSFKRPYIVDDLCTGCGICENKCPLEGRPAIEVFAKRKVSKAG